MTKFYKRFKLAHKVSLIVMVSILLSFFVLGFYFDSFLKENDFQNSKKRILHAYNRLALNFLNTQHKLKQGIAFVQTDESTLASIELINNYQDKKNYNATLLNEEKEHINEQLLNRVKLSLNNDIALYDKHEDLIAYVTKIGDSYRQNFIAYESAKAVIYCKEEDEKFYTKEGCKEYQLIDLKHKSFYDKIKPHAKPLITYHLYNDEIYIKSHNDIFLTDSDKFIGHIEMTSLQGLAYFSTLSNELDMEIGPSVDKKYTLGSTPLLDTTSHEKIVISQTDKEYCGAMSIKTQKNSVYVRVTFQKEMLQTQLTQNRVKLFVILFIITIASLLLLRLIFTRLLANPMETLMQQIKKIGEQNYTQSKELTSGDELETISKNINTLASTIRDRERDLHESQSNLEYISNHDSLTNLPNRRLFTIRLEKAIDIASHYKTKVAIIFFDLDEFKEVNDSLGHDIGDQLLQEVAKRISANLRTVDTFARVGGDEFYILIENFNKIFEVEEVLKKVLDNFKEVFLCDEHLIHSSASIGVSIYPDHGEDSVSLIKNADLAMYQSKKDGRNNYRFYSQELSLALREKRRWVDALKEAIQTCEEFTLLYQPKVSSLSEKIVAVEALVRWNSSELGFVRPDQFIAMAEETNLIVPLGEWILNRACKDFVALQNEGYLLEHVAVNVSSVQLLRSDMVETVKKALSKSSIKAEQLELEITESYIATDEKKALGTLQRFRDMGINLAIDDFGTGFSSLSYLQKLPVTRLKIDKSFIDNLPDSQDSVSIVKVIIALGKTFNLSLTAEGVEKKEQLEFLQNEKCDEIQGYYYAKPLSLDELKKFYKEQV